MPRRTASSTVAEESQIAEIVTELFIEDRSNSSNCPIGVSGGRERPASGRIRCVHVADDGGGVVDEGKLRGVAFSGQPVPLDERPWVSASVPAFPPRARGHLLRAGKTRPRSSTINGSDPECFESASGRQRWDQSRLHTRGRAPKRRRNSSGRKSRRTASGKDAVYSRLLQQETGVNHALFRYSGVAINIKFWA